MVSYTAGAMAAPMWFASLICWSTTRPTVPLHIFRSCGWALAVSSAQPQAVEVQEAWGGRWVPISSGMRNWRSAVQKWLEAQQMALFRKPPESSAPPSTSD